MPSHVTLSSNRQNWRTPKWFLDLVRAVGPIALDPASSWDNPTGADAFYSRTYGRDTVPGYWLGSCGLSGSWDREGLAFINPPYGRHLSGPIEPEYRHTKRSNNGTGLRVLTGVGRGWAARITQDRGEWIALVPVRTETTWWRLLHQRCDWAVFWSSPDYGRRINFVDPSTGLEKKGSNLASTVFYHGPNSDHFLAAFAGHGRPVPGHGTTLNLLSQSLTEYV